MPQFQLSTILGLAVGVFALLSQAFPQYPVLAELAAAVAMIGMQEKSS